MIVICVGIGLIAFCVLFFCTTVHYWGKSREMKRKATELESALASLAVRQTEIEKLKEQVATQKADIQALKEMGDKKDAVQLLRYERCAELMAKRIPGFYQTWENCMDEVLRQEADSEHGLKRIFRPLIDLLGGKKDEKRVARISAPPLSKIPARCWNHPGMMAD